MSFAMNLMIVPGMFVYSSFLISVKPSYIGHVVYRYICEVNMRVKSQYLKKLPLFFCNKVEIDVRYDQ